MSLGLTATNGQPAGLAAWIDVLNLRAGDRVVHVGCGTGYYTAVIAEIVGPTGHVVAIDIDPQLAQRARANLAYLSQAEVHEGDGGTLDVGAVDAVFINAGATHPRAVWLDPLRSGGRLLLPITGADDLNAIGVGGMFLISRRRFGFAATLVSPVSIFPCLGAGDLHLGRALLRKQGLEWREGVHCAVSPMSQMEPVGFIHRTDAFLLWRWQRRPPDRRLQPTAVDAIMSRRG